MRFHCGESMTAIANYLPLARAVEAAGYDGFTVPDSLIYPRQSDSAYSYTDDGGREFIENKPYLETFTQAMAIRAATERLTVTTNVMKLPVRPPVYSAKMASSIAALSGNRFNFGVGLSVWPEDYAVMGVPWEKRGKRFDECIAIVRGLTTGGYFDFHGEFYDFEAVKLNPIPTRPIPILIGGHSDAALKRAATHDGWICAGADPADIKAMLAKIEAHRQTLGTAAAPFRVYSTAMGQVDGDMVKRHAEAGVTDLVVVFRNLYAVEEDSQPLAAKIDDFNRFADQVISRR